MGMDTEQWAGYPYHPTEQGPYFLTQNLPRNKAGQISKQVRTTGALGNILISHLGSTSFPDARAHCLAVPTPWEICCLSLLLDLSPLPRNAKHSLNSHILVAQNRIMQSVHASQNTAHAPCHCCCLGQNNAPVLVAAAGLYEHTTQVMTGRARDFQQKLCQFYMRRKDGVT